MIRRLHIGGYSRCDGWEVLDVNPADHVDHVLDASDLTPFSDGTFAEIYASHVIEHFDYTDVLPSALRDWLRVLIPGGRVFISVPDMDVISWLFLSKLIATQERFKLMRILFGGHIDKHDYHVVGLNMEFLTHFLSEAGYVNIRRVNDFGLFDDTSSQRFNDIPISLNVIAEKATVEHTDPAPSIT
jgi:predicted SAM-dependent methyltransferase